MTLMIADVPMQWQWLRAASARPLQVSCCWHPAQLRLSLTVFLLWVACRCGCRQMLYQLHQLLTASSQVSDLDTQDFKRLLWAAHLTCLANQAQHAGLQELAARQLTALLHYIGIVPADR